MKKKVGLWEVFSSDVANVLLRYTKIVRSIGNLNLKGAEYLYLGGVSTICLQ